VLLRFITVRRTILGETKGRPIAVARESTLPASRLGAVSALALAAAAALPL